MAILNETTMYVLVKILAVHCQAAKIVAAAISLIWTLGARTFIFFHPSES